MPMGRRYNKRRLGSSVIKKGLNHMTVPRAFPTSSLTGTFIGQQTLDLTGAVKLNTSLFQLFAFRNNPDLTDSTHWARNDANGDGIVFPAQVYRNISMWADFYQNVQILGMSYELNFTKFTDDPPTFRAYIWSSCDVDTSAVAAELDTSEPLDVVVSNTGAAFDDFKVIANTDTSVAFLEQSRRVAKVDSVASKAIARVDLDLSFYLPFNVARRNLRIPPSHYRSISLDFGEKDPLTKPITVITSARYGFRNQINVAVISTSADQSVALGQQFFTNLTVKTKIHVKFLDRSLITPA